MHGVHTGRFATVLEGRGAVFGVKFRPGGFHPFLRAPLSILRNRSVPLRELFGAEGDHLGPAVLSQQDDAAMVAAAVDFLILNLPPIDGEVERVGRIVDGVAVDRNLNTLDDLVAQWRISKRALQRMFNEYVGVGPKWVINRYRMHEALERMEQDDELEWARLALELGYFDQAHFIRDFRPWWGAARRILAPLPQRLTPFARLTEKRGKPMTMEISAGAGRIRRLRRDMGTFIAVFRATVLLPTSHACVSVAPMWKTWAGVMKARHREADDAPPVASSCVNGNNA